MHTGNPVYPFFRHAFGGAGLDEVLDPIKRPMAVTLWNVLTALGPLTLEPDRFDSFSHQFGPIFLLFLPASLLYRPPRRVLGLAALGYLFLMICLTQRQSMRFVLIALGPLSVAVAYGPGNLVRSEDRPGAADGGDAAPGPRARGGPGDGAGPSRAGPDRGAGVGRSAAGASRADLSSWGNGPATTCRRRRA